MRKIFLSAVIAATSCGKVVDWKEPQWYKYQLVIDHYTTDSIIHDRILWWQDWQMNTQLDTFPDRWFTVCEHMHIEHQYYTKDDVKIHTSRFPKQIPEIIDTNWINYHSKPR